MQQRTHKAKNMYYWILTENVCGPLVLCMGPFNGGEPLRASWFWKKIPVSPPPTLYILFPRFIYFYSLSLLAIT